MRKHLVVLSLLTLACVGLSFFATHTALAAEDPYVLPPVCPEGTFCPLAPIPGLTDSQSSVVKSDSLVTFFNNLYKYLIGLAAAFAVIEIIWGGLEISTKDSVSKQSDGRARIQQALFGLVLVLSPVLVFSIINPSILNLSINLPALDTATGTSSTGGTVASTTDSQGVETGCTVNGIAGTLLTAICPSEDAAKRWGTANCGVGNSLSAVIPRTIQAGGGAGQSLILCQTNKKFVFIYDKSSFTSLWVNEIDPLAVTRDNPKNGSEALLFAESCNAVGRTTCLDSYLGNEVPCDPAPKTQIPVGTGNGKCYARSLSCQPGKVIGSGYLCDAEPDWTPFQ